MFHPPWIFANDSAALQLARAIAYTGDFERMPILADALEEAGCVSEHILGHLRGGERHSRNCWVLERVLAMALPPERPRRVVWPEPPLGHPDYSRAFERKALPCPCCRRGPRLIHALPKTDYLFIHCWLCEHIEWVTSPGLREESAATLRALEWVVGWCPECGGTRRAFRSKTAGTNLGRAYLKCMDADCNSFEWAEIGPGMAKTTTFSND